MIDYNWGQTNDIWGMAISYQRGGKNDYFKGADISFCRDEKIILWGWTDDIRNKDHRLYR